MIEPHFENETVTVYHGDCLDVLAQLPDASVDSVVTDPPYGLEFMGKDWDAPWKKRGNNPGSAGMSRAGYAKSNGYSNRETPTYGRGWRNLRCIKCGHITSGGSPCRCPGPELVSEGPGAAAAMSAFQDWCEQWATQCLRVLKPGGHLLAFGGTRTWHRLACAVEDAGFEIRDSIAWLYGSGFPKSMNAAKAIDRAAGALQAEGKAFTVAGYSHNPDNIAHTAPSAGYVPPQPVTDDAKRWEGWGTALKPAFEPIIVGRKPLAGTVAANVVQYGTGAINIDACRVGSGGQLKWSAPRNMGYHGGSESSEATATTSSVGRWPANVTIDPDVANEIDQQSSNSSRYFPVFRYNRKAPKAERPNVNNITHPTVKPLELIRWLVRLITPPDGTVLDPFAGSGTTAEACTHENKHCITIEREADYLPLITSRLNKDVELGFDF